jgi:ornithine carbamoyltransferase
MTPKHLVSLAGWTREGIDDVLDRSVSIKSAYASSGASDRLRGKSLALIFHKPSLRTRVSFEVGMTQMGGAALYISDKEIGMQSRETIEDIARVLSGYVDGIMIRTFANAYVERLAENASVPVINGLTDLYHPCQLLADLLTIREQGRALDDIAIAYVGDGNNMAHSWINAAIHYRIDLRIAHPDGYAPETTVLRAATERGARVTCVTDPREAVQGADVVYTDVWASMGQEDERDARLARFEGFQVNRELMSGAKPDALFMHCLPAHRGEEVSEEILEGPRSVVFPQAHNRLHAQKGLLDALLGG